MCQPSKATPERLAIIEELIGTDKLPSSGKHPAA
jgi:hypothetical protein